MDNIMGDLQPRCVSVYINSITLYYPSLSSIDNMDAVFALLEAAILKLSVIKTFMA